MNRREFLASSALAAGVLSPPAFDPQETRNRPLAMKLGCQAGPLTDDRLEFLRRHSVDAVCGSPNAPRDGRMWDADELAPFRERVEKHGLTLDMVAPRFLESTHIDKTDRPAIMLGSSPERDRDIEDIQKLIRVCAQVGIPSIKYNMNLLGVIRTEPAPGRGGTRLSTWHLSEAGERAKRLTRAGRVPADLYWERITYFLERVIPVAAEYKVRMACHPHDPGVPPGFEGVDCVLGTVDGLKRFVSIQENPYHGLNFCQGTVCEMLQDPAREINAVIRYFGERGKIFNVHFRNIRGKRDSFQETFPDEGDVDMMSALLAYKDVGYRHMLMPDHVPQHALDSGGLQAFAFCYGYIRALMQAASRPGVA
jgi:mannonate dehydratase